jgi:GGDEF domain-containing protein
MLAAFRTLAVEVDGVVIRVSASIGIALSTHAGEDDPLLFQQADRALYQAKAGGRDRVVCAGALNVVDAGGARRHRVA